MADTRLRRGHAAGDDSSGDRDVEAVVAASRAFVAVAARTLAPVEGVISLMQWRALVVISGERLSLNAVAEAMGVHASTATRLCDRLVAEGLLLREADPADRRYLSLTLTRKGERLVARVAAARRREVKSILDRIPPPDRHRIALALQEFAAAAGEAKPDRLWDLAVGAESEAG